MKTNLSFSASLCIYIFWCAIVFSGCAPHPEPTPPQYGSPRLIATGKVTDEDGWPLQNIIVAIYGVREESEADMFSYNYTRTDSAGNYMIVRYAGRDTLTEVTLVATDSTDVYLEQTLYVPVVYQDTEMEGYIYPKQKNAYVMADFVLQKK